MKKLDVVNFLKGFSILTIVLMHYLDRLEGLPNVFYYAIDFGGSGVHSFIFLSGFGLALSHYNRPINNWLIFYRKRLLKVYIPYSIFVIFIACFNLFIPLYKDGLYALLGHLFLYKMFDNSIMTSYGYHLWFISTIIQFYLIFPLAITLTTRYKIRAFICSVALSLMWSYLVFISDHADERVWNSFFLQYLWVFVLGIYLAQLYFKDERNFHSIPLLLSIPLGILLSSIYASMALFGGNYGKIFNDIPAFFGYNLLALSLYNFNFRFLNQSLIKLNGFSYSLYLIHMFLLSLLIYGLKQINLSYNFGWFCVLLFILFPIAFRIQNLTNRFYKIIKL